MNERDDGVTAANGAVPVPVRAIDCEGPAFPESSLTVSDPVAGPVAAGVNVTETEQLAPARSCAGQLLTTANAPAAETPDKFSGLPPKLEIVMLLGELADPMFCEKSKVAGVNPMAEGRGLGTGKGVIPKT